MSPLDLKKGQIGLEGQIRLKISSRWVPGALNNFFENPFFIQVFLMPIFDTWEIKDEFQNVQGDLERCQFLRYLALQSSFTQDFIWFREPFMRNINDRGEEEKK